MVAPISFEARLFGSPEVLIHGEPLPRLRSRKGLCLLAHLILRGGAETQRDWLCDALWPDCRLDAARLSLRQSLVDLRRAMGPEAWRIQSPTTKSLRIDLDEAVVDVVEFDRTLDAGTCDREAMDRAIALYRGPLLAGWVDESIATEQEVRRSRIIERLERCAAAASDAGDRDRAIATLRHLIVIHPLSENAQRRLMKELVDDGASVEALEVYRAFRVNLRERLGFDPDPATVELYRSIRRSLQDRHQAEARFVETRAMSGSRTLPRSLTPLIGREEDVRFVQDALANNRLVTITGPGGVGKTRVAIEAARRIDDAAEFERGVGFVSLVDAHQVDAIVDKVGAVIQLESRTSDDPLSSLAATLERDEWLILLDNCEHALDDVCAVVEAVLTRAPRVKILATSRAPLGLNGEQSFALAPLTTPDEDQATTTSIPSVALFLDRARRAAAHVRFDADAVAAIGRICRRLDGIPLAIELAAARVRALSIRQIEDRIEDRFSLLQVTDRNRPKRHQTMEGAIDASYRQLEEDLQRSFREVCVFEEGFTLDAAEAVCTHREALAHVSRLIDASLIYIPTSGAHPLRYSILETIREFGVRKLREAGELGDVRTRRTDYLIGYLSALDRSILTSEQSTVLARIEAERGNWRAALRRCEDDDRFVRLALALREYFRLVGAPREFRRLFELAVARSENVERTLAVDVFAGAAAAHFNQMDIAGARRYLAEARRLLLDDDEPALKARIWNLEGIVTRLEGDLETSLRYAALAVEELACEPDSSHYGQYLANLGLCAVDVGDFARADMAFEESMRVARLHGNRRTIGFCFSYHGLSDALRGDVTNARRKLVEGARIFIEIHDDYRFTWALRNVFRLAMVERRYEAAALLKGVVEAAQDRQGFAASGHRYHRFAEDESALAGALGEDKVERLVARGREMTFADALTLVERLCGAGQ